MLSATTAVLSLLLATSPFASAAAVPATNRVPYNVANPGATPTYTVPTRPSILPTAVVDAYMSNVALRQRQKRAAEAAALDDSVDVNMGLYARDGEVRSIGDTVRSKFWGRRNVEKRNTTATATCVDSTANDTIINSLLYYGGAGYVLSLCPGATILLNDTIYFYNVGQEISTQGLPTGSTRATLVVNGAQQSTAIIGSCDLCQNIVLRNVIVHGSRDTLGYLSDGGALIELGGNTNGQIVDNIWSYEPRGWSALHGIEGYELYCSNMTITNNQIGPSGHSPTNGAQFRRRDTYAPGQWADGISLACKGSQVYGNTITDATDGAIVIFGAVGSMVHDNTIIANTRNLLGGINMVDYYPFGGTFEGTQVYGNTLNANTAMIKIGIALGSMSWGSDNRTASRTYGGVVQGNTFTSGSGYFGYGSSIAGHNNATVINNVATTANFGGGPSAACIPNPMVPSAQAFVYDPQTAPSAQIQNNFNPFQLVFLICNQPGSVLVTGPSAPLSSVSTSASMSSTSSVASSSSISSSASSSASSSTITSSASASAASASSASVASASAASVSSVASASAASVSSVASASAASVSSVAAASSSSVAAASSSSVAAASASSVAAASSASAAAVASSSAAVVAAAGGRHPVSVSVAAAVASKVATAVGRVPTAITGRVPLKVGAVVAAAGSRNPLVVARNFVPLVGDAELLEERDAWVGGATPTASNSAPTFPPLL